MKFKIVSTGMDSKSFFLQNRSHDKRLLILNWYHVMIYKVLPHMKMSSGDNSFITTPTTTDKAQEFLVFILLLQSKDS